MPVLATSATAVRQRRFRLRRKVGLSAVTVDVDLDLFKEALVACGQLTPNEAKIPALVKRELANCVHEWAEFQLKEKTQ
jgi:hypothetical protein